MVKLTITLHHPFKEDIITKLNLEKEEIEDLIRDILGFQDGVDSNMFYRFINSILWQKNKIPPYYSIKHIRLAKESE